MAAHITVLNYVYSLCVFYYSVLSCVADVADCPLQRLSAIVIKNIIMIISSSSTVLVPTFVVVTYRLASVQLQASFPSCSSQRFFRVVVYFLG